MAKTTTTKRGKTEERERLPKFDLDTLKGDDTAEVKIEEYIMTVQGDYGASELFHVNYNGKRFSWFLKHSRSDFRTLKKRFGRDLDAWVGKRVNFERASFEKDGRDIEFLKVAE